MIEPQEMGQRLYLDEDGVGVVIDLELASAEHNTWKWSIDGTAINLAKGKPMARKKAIERARLVLDAKRSQTAAEAAYSALMQPEQQPIVFELGRIPRPPEPGERDNGNLEAEIEEKLGKA